MSDKKKTILAVLFMGCTFMLPLLAGFTGWRMKDWQTGLFAAIVVFILFLALTIITLTRIRVPDWFTVGMPVIFSLLYVILPDFLVGPVDDAGAMLFSSFMSLALWLKRKRELERSLPEIDETVENHLD